LVKRRRRVDNIDLENPIVWFESNPEKVKMTTNSFKTKSFLNLLVLVIGVILMGTIGGQFEFGVPIIFIAAILFIWYPASKLKCPHCLETLGKFRSFGFPVVALPWLGFTKGQKCPFCRKPLT
jgi:hypothetical protein